MSSRKDSVNPFSESEFAIRDFVRGVPEVAGFFGDASQVFAASQEDFGSKLKSMLAGSFGTGVCVSTEGTSGSVWRESNGRLSDESRFKVDVKTSLVLSAERKLSGTDVAAAIIRELDGTIFVEPFHPSDCVRYTGTEIADFDDMTRIVTVRFTARIFLN